MYIGFYIYITGIENYWPLIVSVILAKLNVEFNTILNGFIPKRSLNNR